MGTRMVPPLVISDTQQQSRMQQDRLDTLDSRPLVPIAVARQTFAGSVHLLDKPKVAVVLKPVARNNAR